MENGETKPTDAFPARAKHSSRDGVYHQFRCSLEQCVSSENNATQVSAAKTASTRTKRPFPEESLNMSNPQTTEETVSYIADKHCFTRSRSLLTILTAMKNERDGGTLPAPVFSHGSNGCAQPRRYSTGILLQLREATKINRMPSSHRTRQSKKASTTSPLNEALIYHLPLKIQ
jgi:hypothetical protein